MFQFDHQVATTRYHDRLREAETHRLWTTLRRTRKARR
jgi:hypothetical protein